MRHMNFRPATSTVELLQAMSVGCVCRIWLWIRLEFGPVERCFDHAKWLPPTRWLLRAPLQHSLICCIPLEMLFTLAKFESSLPLCGVPTTSRILSSSETSYTACPHYLTRLAVVMMVHLFVLGQGDASLLKPLGCSLELSDSHRALRK